MPSDSEGKKVPPYILLNRPIRPERRHSPLNPYSADTNHKRTPSGSLPPGLLRLTRTFDDEEDSDYGTPPLQLQSIYSKAISESDSETGVKWTSPNSSLFIHATPPRFHKKRETESDATTLNDSKFRNFTLNDLKFRNSTPNDATCSLPELPKWSYNVNEGYNSDDWESKQKSCRIKSDHKFKLSDVFSDLFLASENRAYHEIISMSREAKCFYWKKRKPQSWVSYKRTRKRLERPYVPLKLNNRYSLTIESKNLLNSPTCVSPLHYPTDEDYEAADDASVASSSMYETGNNSFLSKPFGLNIAHGSNIKFEKSRTSTNNSILKRLCSEGELLNERVSFKESLIDAKTLCDSQLETVHAEILGVLNDESDVSPGVVLIRKYLDEESKALLKELCLFIEKILSFWYDELLQQNTIQTILEELQTIQAKLTDKRNGATGWFGIQTSMAISGVLNIIEHANDEPAIFTRGNMDSETDSLYFQDSNSVQEDRVLYRPSFGQLPNVNGIRQLEWTFEELNDVAEESKLLNIVIVFLKSGEISFISPSVNSVFGYNDADIVGSYHLPFLPPNTSGHHIFQTALQKLNEMDNIFIEVLFKARRSDNLALLMEAKGIRLEGDKGSIWLMRPVALLGHQWKDFGTEDYALNFSPECSPKISNCLVLGESSESLNTDLALCNICERTVPALLFEHHNIVCTNVHRAEMEIISIQDSLDSIKAQLSTQDEFLNEEVQMELLEKENDPEILNEQKLYIESLNNLSKLSQSMMEKVDSLLKLIGQEISVAKTQGGAQDMGSIEQLVDWIMPQHNDFFLSTDLKFKTEGMKMVKDQLSAIGNNLWTIACAFRASLPELKIKISFLRDSAHFFQLAFLQEENIKFEIGLKAGKFKDIDNLDPIQDLLSNIGLENLNLESADNVHSDGSVPKAQISQPAQKKKTARVSRIVVNTEKTLPVQKSDFPKSPLFDLIDFSIKSPLSGNFSSILPRMEPSIKDYSIVKPISKGAYGSVYLAQKKVSGDYYAIKVLKKADMIAKNQVTNVRAERIILTQLDSPYVVRLYYSFQSKNHLYLVMEYLNGGDCASLLKAFGSLDEKWARQYVSEMVLGLEFLHEKGVVHRDMKPDNLLIDSKGHLRITDFGLSRMGFISHRSCPVSQKVSDPQFVSDKANPLVDYVPSSTYTLASAERRPKSMFESGKNRHDSIKTTPICYQPSISPSSISPFGQLVFPRTHHRRDSMASISSIKSFCSNTDMSSPEDKEEANVFLGTPDYLAPESIMGEYQDTPVDWWAVGVILYEFLFGYPPFNADTAQKVFENILHKNINWHEGLLDISVNARNLMELFLEMDSKKRLGSQGVEEIRQHPWFEDVIWEDLNLQEASFIPRPPEATDTNYFDNRGAVHQNFEDDDNEELNGDEKNGDENEELNGDENEDLYVDESKNRKLPQEVKMDNLSPLRDSRFSGKKDTDFGGFMYRNLPLLEKANQKLVQKLQSGFTGADRLKSLKFRNNVSSESSVNHIRKGSFRSGSRSGIDSESDTSEFNIRSTRRSRQASVPLRSRQGSDFGKRPNMSPYATLAITKSTINPRSSISGQESKSLDILVADSKAGLLPDFLHKLGCRIIQVETGPEALALSISDIKFDLILLDSKLPIVSCNQVSRFIKTVSYLNQHSPMICITSSQHTFEQIQEFDDVLSKPISFDILKHVITAIKAEPMSARGFTF